MAVTFDAVGPNSGAFAASGTPSSPQAWPHTCGASASLLLVAVSFDTSSSFATVNPSATYNGVSMALIGSWQSGGSSQNAGFIAAWSMASPPTGAAHNVSIAWTGGAPDIISGGSLSFDGYSTLGTVYNSDSGGGGVTSGSATVATTTTGGICVCFMTDGSGGVTSDCTGTMQFQEQLVRRPGRRRRAAVPTSTSTGSAGHVPVDSGLGLLRHHPPSRCRAPPQAGRPAPATAPAVFAPGWHPRDAGCRECRAAARCVHVPCRHAPDTCSCPRRRRPPRPSQLQRPLVPWSRKASSRNVRRRRVRPAR